MKQFILALSVIVLASCGSSNDANVNVDSANNTVGATTPAIRDIQSYRPNIINTPWEGDLFDAVYWRDARGENATIISGKPQYFWEVENPEASKFFPEGGDKETLSELTEIFAQHYVLNAGESKWRIYYSYHDFLFGCCDVWMQYQAGSLQVVDADSNGTGETLFMYHETEGDGIIEHNYLGTMILEKDSAIYLIEDETGLGTQLRREKEIVADDKVVIKTPADSVYSVWMWRKWTELYNIKVEQDRESITEKNNVDEHGHADHVH